MTRNYLDSSDANKLTRNAVGAAEREQVGNREVSA